MARTQDGIHVLDATWDDRYRDVLGLVPVVARFGGERVELTIAYTGLHGTGALAVPAALKAFDSKTFMRCPPRRFLTVRFRPCTVPTPRRGLRWPRPWPWPSKWGGHRDGD